MVTDEEDVSVRGWMEHPTKERSQAQRWDVLRNWVLGNGLLESIPDTHGMKPAERDKVQALVVEAAERGISALREKPSGVYGSINGMIGEMRKRGSSESTIFGHRFKIVSLFRWANIPYNAEKIKDKVKDVSAARVTDDKALTPEQIKGGLTNPLGLANERFVLSVAVCTGARIGEISQINLKDIYWKETPVRVEFPARKTKTARNRYSFLSSECVDLIKKYLNGRTTGWLFPGEVEGHLSSDSIGLLLHKLFIKMGLVQEKEGNGKAGAAKGAHNDYHPHVLRKTNLNRARSK